MKHADTTLEIVKAAPPISVGGIYLWGIHLNEWLVILTVLYTVFLIVDKVPVVLIRMQSFAKWLGRLFK